MNNLKTSLSFLLALVMTTQTLASSVDQNADLVIANSHLQARQDAEVLMSSDFSNTMMNILLETSQSADSTAAFQTYNQKINEMQDRLSDILKESQSQTKIDQKLLLELWTSYKSVVRDRFAISFQAEDQLYSQEQALRLTERAIDSFEATCATGRSEIGLTYYKPTLPNLPAPSMDFALQFNFGTESNSPRGLTAMSSHSSTSTGKDEGRQSTGAAIYAAASVSSSVALSGSTGAAATAATTAAPVLVGVAVAYAAYSHFAAAEEQARLQNEMVAAQVRMFEKVANDGDVALYYRQACSSMQILTQSLKASLQQLRGTSQQREELIAQALPLSAEIEAYSQAAKNQADDLEQIQLLLAAERNQCAEVGVDLSTSKLNCGRDLNSYISKRVEKIRIPLDLKEARKQLLPAFERASEFAKKYPREERVKILTAQIVLSLGTNWEQTVQNLRQMSFDNVDAMMSSVFSRLQVVFAQLRAQQTASWNQTGDAIFDELQLQEKFELMKKHQRLLVADGIRVIFGRKDRVQFRAEVVSHLLESKKFCKEHFSLPEARSFYAALEALEKDYKSF